MSSLSTCRRLSKKIGCELVYARRSAQSVDIYLPQGMQVSGSECSDAIHHECSLEGNIWPSVFQSLLALRSDGIEPLSRNPDFVSSKAEAQRKSSLNRFWGKVHVAEGCWTWTGSMSRGYGTFLWEGRVQKAHRVSYQIAFGVIPDQLLIRHKCDNKSCVNPDHLEVGTPADNNRDCCVRETRVWVHLRNAQVYEARKLHLFGFTDVEIGKVFGVSSGVVNRCRRGGSKHVPWPEVFSSNFEAHSCVR